MFYIKTDDVTLWSPVENKLKVVAPTLNLEVNKIGSLSFKIYPDHVCYNRFVKMQSIVSVHQDNRTLFKGRVYSDNVDFHKVKKIEVEGVLGYFNDSAVRPYEFTGSVENYFRMLIDQHNEQVEPFQRFKVGVVTVTDPNDYIVRSSENAVKTWDEINNKLIKLLNGYISVRYEDDGNYVDYLADYTDVSTQDIEFSVNLLDLVRESNANTLSTCIVPYGAKDETTGERVTIKSVNGGLDYLVNKEAVAIYGRISEVVTWDDVTTEAALLKKATAYLANKVKLPTKFTVKAIDLHLTDHAIEAFKLGDYIRVYSNPHEIDERILLTAYNMDLSNPSGCTITLGIETSSYTGSQVNTYKDAVNRIDVVHQEVAKASSRISNEVISESITYINESVETSEENIRSMMTEYARVSELETVREEMALTVSQTSKEVNLQFDTVNERITNESGEILRILDENSKYIRLVDGNVILGELGALLTTKISNGRISFLYNDTIEVAYISDNKLYITNAEILDSIVIGNFGFIPRANGNLSFKKVR